MALYGCIALFILIFLYGKTLSYNITGPLKLKKEN